MNERAPTTGRSTTSGWCLFERTENKRHQLVADRPERACFDLRLHIEGADRDHVFELLSFFAAAARRSAPTCVDVDYSTLKPAKGLRFRPTVVPKRSRS